MSDTVEVPEDELETILEYVREQGKDAACPPEVAEAQVVIDKELDDE